MKRLSVLLVCTVIPCWANHAQNATKPAKQISLDDLRRGSVPLLQALPILDVDDPPFERDFAELLKKNPKWNDEAAALLREWSAKPATFDEREREWAVLIQGFRDEPAVADWVSKVLRDPKADRGLRQHLLRVMARMQAPPSDEWLGDLSFLLKDDTFRRDVLAIVRKHNLADFDRAIAALANRKDLPVELRIAAIDAIAVRLRLSPDLFALLLHELKTNADPVIRLMAGRALSWAKLSEAQAKEVAAAIPKLSTSWGMLVLPAFSRQRADDVGLAIVKSLRGSATAKAMTPADINRILASYSNEVNREAAALREEIILQTPEGQAESFAKLTRELPPGDAQRGRDVFFQSKAACASCHRAAGQGGGVGPNLSRVGFLRSNNELLESIVLPNASQVPEFRAWKVTTDRGLSFTGFLVVDTSEFLFLRDADRALRRIPRASVEELEMARISLMPEGLDKLLTRQELADVVQFLAELR